MTFRRYRSFQELAGALRQITARLTMVGGGAGELRLPVDLRFLQPGLASNRRRGGLNRPWWKMWRNAVRNGLVRLGG